MSLQLQFSQNKIHWKHRYSHGGVLRQKRAGRGVRPLSSRESLHLVFKANRSSIRGGFRLARRFAVIHQILQQYQSRFYIKVSQISIQGDHLHLLIRTSRRSNYQSFFRVVSGQIAQRFEKEGLLSFSTQATGTPKSLKQRSKSKSVTGTLQKKQKLWKHRPFTRVVRGWRAYRLVREYIQLNEKEALGMIPYRKERLKGLSSREWQLLWS
jgi:REP element-mobilizing transposase RayT